MQLTMPGGWSPEDKIWYQRKSWDMNWGRRRIAGCAQSSSTDQDARNHRALINGKTSAIFLMFYPPRDKYSE